MYESPPTMAAALEAFANHLTITRKSANTLRTYTSLLRPLTGLELVSGFTPQLGWELVILRVRGGQDATTLHAALSSLARFLVAEGMLHANPMAGIPRPPRKSKGHRYLTAEEVGRLWVAAGESREPDLTKLIVCLLLEGLRRSELADLRWRDVQSDRIIIHGKGGTVRAVPLRARTKALLTLMPHGDRVFAFGGASLYQRIVRLGERAKVAHVHPHLWRHTWASQHLLAGGDPLTLQQLGGWKNDWMIRNVYAVSAREESALRAAEKLDLTERLLGEG